MCPMSVLGCWWSIIVVCVYIGPVNPRRGPITFKRGANTKTNSTICHSGSRKLRKDHTVKIKGAQHQEVVRKQRGSLAPRSSPRRQEKQKYHSERQETQLLAGVQAANAILPTGHARRLSIMAAGLVHIFVFSSVDSSQGHGVQSLQSPQPRQICPMP